jgi:OmpA-OmpF porin, OOP family
MKKQLLATFAFATLAVSALQAQSAEKKWGIGLYGGTLQYRGEAGDEFFSFNPTRPTFGITASRYINPWIDLVADFGVGGLGYAGWVPQFSGDLYNLDFVARIKFNNGKWLKENAIIAPYVFIGAGDAIYREPLYLPRTKFTVDFNFPAGAGVRVRLTDNAYLRLQTAYHWTLTDVYDGISRPGVSGNQNDQFLTTTAGLVFNIDRKDTDKDGVYDKFDKCPGTPVGVKIDAKGCPLDKDQDGIMDADDSCPEVAGVASANGCPDADGDGIKDSDDACPNEAGDTKNGGCPDKDGDGVIDKNDRCPDVAGSDKFAGCPDTDGDGTPDIDDKCPNERGRANLAGCPDSDGDGIPNAQDKCPNQAGLPANNGCPEVKEETKKVLAQALAGVQFETGKDVIKKSSFAILDNVVKVMMENPEYKLSIEGHTDNQGDDAKNLDLSQRRANAVMKYLTDKGVDAKRLRATGFGETKPVDTNDTAPGRAKNRRVEFKIEF